MDSLLASYASSDEEDEGSQLPILRSNPPKGKENSGFLSSLPPPKSSSSRLFSLPPPKVQNPISSTSSASIKPQKVDVEQTPQLQGNREDSGLLPSLPRPSSSLLSSLPQPKSSSSSSSASLFSSLPSPKTYNAENHALPQLSSASPALASRKIVQFRPPIMNHSANFGNEDEEDEDEEEKEKKRRKSESLLQTLSVNSFLSSIPKPKNSTTLGVLPSASGTGRRSMLEAEVPGSNTGTGSVADSSGGYYDSNSADNHVPVSSTSDASGFSDNVPGSDYSGWGSGNENYVNYDGYTGYGSNGVSDEGYSNSGVGTADYANYGSEYGSYASYGQYQSDWTDGSPASAVPQMSGPTGSVLRTSGKRGRNDAPAEIVEVNQDELMKNRPREDQVKLTGIAFGPAYQVTKFLL